MTEQLAKRDWVPEISETRVQGIAKRVAGEDTAAIAARIEDLARENRIIHEKRCFNLNPATNVMNPRAEALLASGIGTRPSLGYPGDKYEMGLQAIEEIEVICAELCAEVFGARYAEIRVPSGAIANLYGFMALAKPGDQIIVPPAKIGGHVTHHIDGCAGLYGLHSHEAPVDADGYSVDLDGLAQLADKVKPKLITIGGSLNLYEHPVREIREIADRTGAYVLFDAAHQCGIIAGRAWKNPLDEGAHLMTMSTYKSLGGPPSGLIVTNEGKIAKRLDSIAFPGMTANFDAAKSAALAMAMLDWKDHGQGYAQAMVDTAQALAKALTENGIPVFEGRDGPTHSHQFAILAEGFGGGQTASKKLEKAGFLACGIGLPAPEVPNDLNGLRIGTPEIVRWGMTQEHMPELAVRIANALRSNAPEGMADETAKWRESFDKLHFIHSG
ncbi:serine hydroxymethyltransferase [Marimonas lutisalis]|uniref:serine hydroxymethyltransferase n=1 Tax=Marimonas lutisalis TaxID=2545756 RepID=UPI0010F8076C|nr:aminotransferase class I/II-fold pyridoxal phosphate-dependent enzyme [Marimonas lutisalis]